MGINHLRASYMIDILPLTSANASHTSEPASTLHTAAAVALLT